MYCARCPIFPFVEAIIAYRRGETHPLLDEAFSRIEELRTKCTSCHKKARKYDTHLGPDRDAGRSTKEVSIDQSFFALEKNQGNIKINPDYIDGRRRDTSTGCTSKLSPEVEDALRIVLASIMQLSPLELLLVQHAFTRQQLSTFRKPLRDLRDRLTSRYDLGDDSTSFRALVHSWKNKIVAKVPALTDVFAATVD